MIRMTGRVIKLERNSVFEDGKRAERTQVTIDFPGGSTLWTYSDDFIFGQQVTVTVEVAQGPAQAA